MRIGIITHWKDQDNYGAALQSYALQSYLRSKGHDAFVIRYYAVNSRNSLPRRVINFIKNPFILHEIRKAQKKQIKLKAWNEQRDFASFRSKNVALSEREYRGYEDLKNYYPIAELYLTGSDQVWHGSLKNPQNRAFFLDFGTDNTIRASYAASFGRDYFPCEDEALFKQLLSRFKAISMREESGIEILSQRGISSSRCLDSTLLLPFNQYRNLMSGRKHLEKYAFFYTVNVTSPEEIYWGQIKQYLKERGIKSVVTTGSGYRPAEEIFNGAEYDYATIEEWLSNIYYSEIVVTASFHGVALSYILKKNFIYTPLQGKYGKGNDRITDLLEAVGLLNRVANNWSDVVRLCDEKINYTEIKNEKFLKLLNQSESFLKNLTE